MTDVIAQPTSDLPTWYQQAQAAYEAEKADRQTEVYLRVKRQADAVNARLEAVGVTPLRAAGVAPGLRLQPALLIKEDPEAELYAVYATWDDTREQVALEVADYENPRHVPRYARLLGGVGDIVAARHEGPAPQAHRVGPQDLRTYALTAGERLSQDYLTPDGYAVADQVAALTAAVVHLADTLAHCLARP